MFYSDKTKIKQNQMIENIMLMKPMSKLKPTIERNCGSV